MKTYFGVRASAARHKEYGDPIDRPGDGLQVWVRDGWERLYPLRHLAHHSPSGFDCGYAGSGPADLALALASDVLGEEDDVVTLRGGLRVGRQAWRVHHQLKLDVVACLPRDQDWLLQEPNLRARIQRALGPSMPEPRRLRQRRSEKAKLKKKGRFCPTCGGRCRGGHG